MMQTAPAAAAVVKALRASENNVMRKLEIHSPLALGGGCGCFKNTNVFINVALVSFVVFVA